MTHSDPSALLRFSAFGLQTPVSDGRPPRGPPPPTKSRLTAASRVGPCLGWRKLPAAAGIRALVQLQARRQAPTPSERRIDTDTRKTNLSPPSPPNTTLPSWPTCLMG